jgi:hypothetical protein
MFRRPAVLAVGAFLLVAACSTEESNAPDSHSPESVKLFDGATELTEPFQFQAAQTLRVEVKLYNDHGEEVVLDDHHVVGVTFTPSSLATVAAVAGEPTQFDVTGGTAGSGTATVGWGHDDPNELTFSFDVDVGP